MTVRPYGQARVLTQQFRSKSCLPLLWTRCFTRPSFAPHPIPDIKHIAQNPGLYEQNCVDRNYGKLSHYPWAIADLRRKRIQLDRITTSKRQKFQELQNNIRDAQGYSKTLEGVQDRHTGLTDEELSKLETARQSARELKVDLDSVTTALRQYDERIEHMALALPNLSSVHTPNGAQARILDTVINIPEYRLAQLKTSHVDIGTQTSILNFSQSAATSGWGWYFLHGAGALLEQALVQYAISELVHRGWHLVSPPSMVYSHIASACGFQPRDQNDEQQIYGIERSHETETANSDLFQHVLAGTAEIPLAGMQAQTILEDHTLPLKTAAVSRSYRAEAGARGTDTKGLYRVHEFTKVEMFAWTMPDNNSDPALGGFDTSPDAPSQSDEILAEMIDVQRNILSSLGLNIQILEMPTTDLSASATRKIDMEVYFPSRRERHSGWGEVTSASVCTDYQTRRLRTRLSRAGSGQQDFPWSLNGTAMAIPRVLAAILECGWDEQSQAVVVPKVLRPWMHGIEMIEATKKKKR